MLWEIIFVLVILKIPIVYVGWVIWWAIKAEPELGAEGGTEGVNWKPWRRPSPTQLARDRAAAASSARVSALAVAPTAARHEPEEREHDVRRDHPRQRLTDRRTRIAIVLLAIAAIGAIVAIFFQPFAVGPASLFLAIVGITISVKHRALGLCVTRRRHALLADRRLDRRLGLARALTRPFG